MSQGTINELAHVEGKLGLLADYRISCREQGKLNEAAKVDGFFSDLHNREVIKHLFEVSLSKPSSFALIQMLEPNSQQKFSDAISDFINSAPSKSATRNALIICAHIRSYSDSFVEAIEKQIAAGNSDAFVVLKNMTVESHSEHLAGRYNNLINELEAQIDNPQNRIEALRFFAGTSRDSDKIVKRLSAVLDNPGSTTSESRIASSLFPGHHLDIRYSRLTAEGRKEILSALGRALSIIDPIVKNYVIDLSLILIGGRGLEHPALESALNMTLNENPKLWESVSVIKSPEKFPHFDRILAKFKVPKNLLPPPDEIDKFHWLANCRGFQ